MGAARAPLQLHARPADVSFVDEGAFLVERPAVDGKRVFALGERLGSIEAFALHATARELGDVGDVVLDCSALTYLGGAGLQVLLAWKADLTRRGHTLALIGATPNLQRTLAQAGAAL